MLECSASTTRSDRYSLKNPRPTLNATMPKMIKASVRSPVASEINVAAASRVRNGLRS